MLLKSQKKHPFQKPTIRSYYNSTIVKSLPVFVTFIGNIKQNSDNYKYQMIRFNDLNGDEGIVFLSFDQMNTILHGGAWELKNLKKKESEDVFNSTKDSVFTKIEEKLFESMVL